jgi:MFS superfamily sulfate permease-like transporter
MTAAPAVVVGIVAVPAGLARLGLLAGFISEPVLKGFIIGLALTIIAGQLPKLFGVERTDGNGNWSSRSIRPPRRRLPREPTTAVGSGSSASGDSLGRGCRHSPRPWDR